jgi:hypothetical protein
LLCVICLNVLLSFIFEPTGPGNGDRTYAIYFGARDVALEFPVVFFPELAQELPSFGKLVDVWDQAMWCECV